MLNRIAILLVVAGCAAPHAPGSGTLKSLAIGPAGGTLAVTAAESATLAGTSISIPAGALSASVTITISASSQAVAQSGDLAAGPVVEFAPDGTRFSVPATITLPVSIPSGYSANNLSIEAVEGDGAVRTIPVGSQASGFATFQTNSFTRFGGVIHVAVDGGVVICNCPASPSGCFVQGPGPCYCPMACDGGAGGSCSTNRDCPSGDFCSLTNCAPPGTCEPLPQVCPQDCAEPMLCGCDGHSYCNSCIANAAGTSISTDGSACSH